MYTIGKRFISWAALLLVTGAALYAQTQFEVAPQGKYRTLEAARDAVRQLRSSGEEGAVTVVIREGDYLVDESIHFGFGDRNTTYRAAAGERVRFFGGKVIDPQWFKPLRDRAFALRLTDPDAARKIFVADLKAHGITEFGEPYRHGWMIEPKGAVPPASLKIAGQRMRLARWPNPDEASPYMVYKHYLEEERPLKGYEVRVQAIIDSVKLPGEVTFTKVVDPGSTHKEGGAGGTFEVAFDRMQHWSNINDIFVDGVLSSTWVWSYNQLSSVDVEKRQITLAHPELQGVGLGPSVRLPHFYFENIAEEIDQPGEYYIDRERGLLYLYPPAERGVMVLSALAEPMFTVRDAGNLRFEGMEFDTGRNLCFEITESQAITIDRCRIANFDRGGVLADGRQLRVLNSHIHSIGGYGVSLNGGNQRTLEPAENEVVNCEIHDFGWREKSQIPGVLVDGGVGHRIAHNEIYDAPHFGIRIKRANDVLVEYNEVYDLPKYHKFDGGALYIHSGRRAESRGFVIRGNYFHDVPTIGVYPDNFSWGVEISHNLFVNVGALTNRAPIFVNGGGECRTFNNVAVDCSFLYGQGVRPKEEQWLDYWNATLAKYGDGKVESTAYNKYPDFKQWLTKTEKDEFFRPASSAYNNLLYHPNGPIYQGQRINANGMQDLTGGKLATHGNLALSDDPGFVDAASGDYRLRSDASVFQLIPGFEPLPIEKMGRLDAQSIGSIR
jgi:hypothetical protein